jgi:hypothetical protein
MKTNIELLKSAAGSVFLAITFTITVLIIITSIVYGALLITTALNIPHEVVTGVYLVALGLFLAWVIIKTIEI